MSANWAGVAVGLIGIALACYFYLAGRRVKDLRWTVRSVNIIQGYRSKVEDLHVSYRGVDVENLTVSKILVWNEGRETIDRDDIAPADPLRVATRDGVRIHGGQIAGI
jgi:hypothetical protein